ncbi:MAG: adenylate/guanylate cyclase domain-containing protein [Acetobacteraceae bacterium]|nr:adenylate/guanylate cyclase domain-containing protein [Acetobacteraceae bacterium]
MDCPRCGATAPGRNRFCGECGAALPWLCAGCGAANAPGNAFCSDCGTSAARGQAGQTPAKPVAERRQVTVMFCDMVDSTVLGTRLDPEDLREVITAYHGCVTQVVARFGGYIARYMGDGVLVYFGYPAAHEDDAERAVRAGLAITAAVSLLDTPAGPAGRLATRVGIATGLVVVGDEIGAGASREQTIVGDTPNLAARLQGLADPGTVVIGTGTRNLIGGLFDCVERGAALLKGYSTPVPTWTVLRESQIDSRFEALRTGRGLALLGRDAELELLLHSWDDADGSHGRVVLLSGEAGIGKSRLTAALEERLHDEPHLRLRYLCSPHYQDSALHPVIAQIARAARFGRDDDAATRLRKLDAMLAISRASPEEKDAFADLMGLPTREAGLQRLTPARRKERTFEAILGQLTTLARTRPILVVLEDMHWADATTLELLERLVERIGSMRVLLVVTTRPVPPPAWVDQPPVRQQLLSRLDRTQAATLIDEVTGLRRLPKAVADQILAHADGVPLFVEELARTMLESGADRPQDHNGSGGNRTGSVVVPSSLHASLTARLDRLAGGKEVAQMGAVIGRDFSFETFQSVFGTPDGQLRAGLRALIDADLLVEIGREPHVVYSFRHALVQDAAYASLLRDRRRSLHLQAAEALEREASDSTEPEILAYHYAAAGVADRAVDHHLRAAEQAMARSAAAEMVSHLRRGLGLLEGLPDTPQTRRRELQLQTALGRGLIDTVGSSSEEGHAAFERARALCLELGENDLLMPILYGLQVYHFTHAEPEIVVGYANEILDLGARTGNRRAIVLGERVSGSAYLLLGRFAEARRAYENLLRLYDVTQDGGAAADTPRDPLVASCAFLGICLTVMGYPGEGRVVEQRGLDHAEALHHAISVVFSLRRACIQHTLTRDVERVGRLAGRLLEVTVEYETFLGGPEGALFESWARLHAGFDAAEHKRMLLALDQLDAAKTWAMLPYMMAAAADVSWDLGDHATAQRLLERAAELVRLAGERWCEAEIMRLEARFMPDGSEEATARLEQALDLARSQGARLWELRIARDLAQRMMAAGDTEAASALLVPLCTWFNEGRSLPDFIEAASLVPDRCKPNEVLAREGCR